MSRMFFGGTIFIVVEGAQKFQLVGHWFSFGSSWAGGKKCLLHLICESLMI